MSRPVSFIVREYTSLVYVFSCQLIYEDLLQRDTMSCLLYYSTLQMCFDAFDEAADLDVLDHPILNFIYYLVSIQFYLLLSSLTK